MKRMFALIAVLALVVAFTMPVTSAVAGDKAKNPCAAQKTSNPCNPCAAQKTSNPCNPCAAQKTSNPCNPCAQKAKNPCGKTQ